MDSPKERFDPEVLTGAKAIADHFGFTRRQVYHWMETPKFRFPGFNIGRTVCARPREIRRWLAEQEQPL